MAEDVTIRPLESLDDARAASELFDRIWGERRIMGAPLLRAMASHGGQVLGAFDGDVMVGAQAGLVGIVDGKPVLHSHITGVAEDAQHRGIGFLLKVAQREWCLEHGIDRVTSTFDPMVARNAYFNLHKLGAIGDRFHRDYYGPMTDSFNRGDRSDRLEVLWPLRSGRVAEAVAGRPAETVLTGDEATIVADADGEPRRNAAADADTVLVRIPTDYHALRDDDPARAQRWREAVGDALEDAYGRGFVAVAFAGGSYVLERR